MTTVTRLSAYLSANTAEFESGFKRASKTFQEFEKKSIQASKAVGAAIAGAALALGALGIRSAALIGEQNDLAKSLGITQSALASLNVVAGESGVEQEALTAALGKMQKSLIDASSGSGAASSAFSQLGLNVKNLLDLTPDQQFAKIGEALDGIENPAQRTAAAMAIFGKAGRDLIPVFENFKQKSDEAKAYAERFNIALNEIDVQKVDEAGDAASRVTGLFTGLGNTIAVEVSPFVTALSDELISAAIDGDQASSLIRKGMEGVGIAIDATRKAVIYLQYGFQAILKTGGDAIAKLMLKLYDLGVAISSVLNKIPGVSVQAENGLLKVGLAAKKMADESGGAISDLKKEIDNFESTATKMDRIRDAADKRAATNATNQKKYNEAMKSVNDDGGVGGSSKIKNIAKDTRDAAEEFKSLGEIGKDAFDGIADALARGEDGFKSLRSVAINVLSDIVKSTFASASNNGNSFSGLFGGLTSGISSLFSKLPSFDVGSNYVPSDMVANIHKGEMIIPAREAAAIRSGYNVGGDTINIDARGASAGVEQKIRQVMMDVQNLRSQTPNIAVQSVRDAQTRGRL